jgi:pimeloyl-ACP methyl ester carboxylesterase
MKCVVFLPGIMGSELRHAETNKRVWPPSLGALVTKSIKAEALLDENLVATKPIESVTPFYSVYRSILRDIQACGYSLSGSESGSERRFIPFAYDWRKSNQASALALSEHLDQQESFDEIVLIGHSMGGLILRYLLESGEFDQRPWFKAITQLITLGTPHNGAPIALNQIAGLASNLGISAENLKLLVSDKRYPSAYQLVAPNGSAMTLNAASSSRLPYVVDPFDSEIVARYQLQYDNIDAALRFWSKLDLAKRPEKVAYFSFVGSAHTTLTRLEWTGSELLERESNDSGDGTVPISSSLNGSIPHSFSQKKHSTIFADRNLRVELFKMLGAPSDVTPHSLSGRSELLASNVMGISTDREDYRPLDNMEIVVSFLKPQINPRCRFQLVKIDPESESGEPLNEVGDAINVSFNGLENGLELQNFKFSVAMDLSPGVYELQTSDQVDDPERSFFVVSEDPTSKR